MGSSFYRLYQTFQGEVLAIPGRLIAFIFFILLLFIPLITSDPYVLRILILANIFAIFAVSWDFLAGFAGQLSLGQSLFFGVAAYTAALLNRHFNLPPGATIPLGALAAVVAGLIIGIPALRLRGFYLALVTLVFPLVLASVLYVFPNFTGGEFGIYGIDPLSSSRVSAYYIALLAMIVSILVMWKLTDIKSEFIQLGVVLQAVREDEITARASGINTTRYKFLAFAISGFFAGIAGGIYAHFMKVAGPSTLELLFAFYPVLWTIFGGMGTIYGPVVGVYILYPLTEVLGLHPMTETYRMAIFALILLLTLIFMPYGIATRVRDRIEVRCPRCQTTNAAPRRFCRVCGVPLHSGESDRIK